jgi:hypothetical protein
MDALRPGEQFVCLVDFVGLGRKNADLKALLACFEVLQKFYVERVMHLWFAQPPALFWCVAQGGEAVCVVCMDGAALLCACALRDDL